MPHAAAQSRPVQQLPTLLQAIPGCTAQMHKHIAGSDTGNLTTLPPSASLSCIVSCTNLRSAVVTNSLGAWHPCSCPPVFSSPCTPRSLWASLAAGGAPVIGLGEQAVCWSVERGRTSMCHYRPVALAWCSLALCRHRHGVGCLQRQAVHLCHHLLWASALLNCANWTVRWPAGGTESAKVAAVTACSKGSHSRGPALCHMQLT